MRAVENKQCLEESARGYTDFSGFWSSNYQQNLEKPGIFYAEGGLID